MKLLNLKDNYIKALEKKICGMYVRLNVKKETYKVKEKSDGEKNKISGKSITLKYFGSVFKIDFKCFCLFCQQKV